MLFFILLGINFDVSLTSTVLPATYAILQVNSTWNTFCSQHQAFQNSLANFVSYKTQIITRSYQILFLNVDSECSKSRLQGGIVHLYVSISHEKPNEGTQDLEKLKAAVSALKNNVAVGGFQVITADLFTATTETATSLTTKMIIIIIAAVLAVYMLGYFCILATQSDSSNDVHLPKAYVVSTMNKVYKGQGNIHDAYGREDKRL